MKNYLIIIVFLGSVLAGIGQPSGSGANGTSVQKHPFRFHTYTPHIYVDAFLNDSLPAGHASKAPFKDVIGYFGFGLLQRMGEVVIDFPNQVVYFKPRA
jgi:hypothetical protein